MCQNKVCCLQEPREKRGSLLILPTRLVCYNTHVKKLQVTTKKTNKKSSVLLPTEFIERKIYFINGHKIMLDSDLAKMYGVSVKRLNEAVKRNIKRFPLDFMFQLSIKESKNLPNARSQFATLEKEIPKSQIVMLNLKSQIATSSYGGRRTLPYVFTEQGVAMLSSVLRSDRAVEVNIAIMRVFVHIRELMISNKDLTRRINDLENKYDSHFKTIFDAIRQLLTPPPKPVKIEIKKVKMGFTT
jgi:hypothetical protein